MGLALGQGKDMSGEKGGRRGMYVEQPTSSLCRGPDVGSCDGESLIAPPHQTGYFLVSAPSH